MILSVAQSEDAESGETESPLHSSVWTDEHLLALGRLVELSARLEFFARQLLAQAASLPSGTAEALFIGSPMSKLKRQLQALATVEGAPTWAPRAADWVRRAASAVEVRDSIVHRPPAFVMHDGEWRPAMLPSRRSQETETIDDQIVPLLRQMQDLVEEAAKLMGEIIGRPGGHIELRGGQ